MDNETVSAFILRCIKIKNKFDMMEGELPLFRLTEKMVFLLFKVEDLKPVLNEFYGAIGLLRSEYGLDNNEFKADIEDISRLFKAYYVPHSFNLKPTAFPANIAALLDTPSLDASDDCWPVQPTDECSSAPNISALDSTGTSKPRRWTPYL